MGVRNPDLKHNIEAFYSTYVHHQSSLTFLLHADVFISHHACPLERWHVLVVVVNERKKEWRWQIARTRTILLCIFMKTSTSPFVNIVRPWNCPSWRPKTDYLSFGHAKNWCWRRQAGTVFRELVFWRQLPIFIANDGNITTIYHAWFMHTK